MKVGLVGLDDKNEISVATGMKWRSEIVCLGSDESMLGVISN